MSERDFDGTYLTPLFELAVQSREDGYYRPLPPPEPRSSLATDDAPLGPWPASQLIRTSYSAGLAHVDALRRLTAAGEIDATSPWTLLRGALENFATGSWLLDGASRTERRQRALALWAEDMRNRAQHEHDTGHVPDPQGASGTERRQEIRDLATTLGLPALAAPKTGLILEQAAPAAGLDPVALRASWRAASGFAHGRYWAHLRISTPRDAAETDDGYLLKMVLDENEHRKLTGHCHTLLRHFTARYLARATSH
ncbi:hypothetical protein [Streptomyces tauricus]|uniref:hypothetical protein n=1 Tax=Streptomyces tauricus TaxID=68274 RepID=UPI0022435815|nr:hypothetical protein [Streptomyces tauricus]MCW8103011.1 hypothetical protein [Streptomyces tauricus]